MRAAHRNAPEPARARRAGPPHAPCRRRRRAPARNLVPIAPVQPLVALRAVVHALAPAALVACRHAAHRAQGPRRGQRRRRRAARRCRRGRSHRCAPPRRVELAHLWQLLAQREDAARAVSTTHGNSARATNNPNKQTNKTRHATNCTQGQAWRAGACTCGTCHDTQHAPRAGTARTRGARLPRSTQSPARQARRYTTRWNAAGARTTDAYSCTSSARGSEHVGHANRAGGGSDARFSHTCVRR